MKIMIVDDEELARFVLKKTIMNVIPSAQILEASNGKQALEWIRQEDIDLAFLDIEMPGMDGITLSKRLKEIMPTLNIFFTTAYSSYAAEAARTYFSGYFLKPVTCEMIKEGLENLRFPIHEKEKGLFVRCFGEFEIFYDNKPFLFHRKNSKELFAYLIHLRGAAADTRRLCETLWPEVLEAGTKERSYLRHLISDIRKTLEEIGQEDIFIKERNSFSINVKKVNCDLYRFLDGDPKAVNQYSGEYMLQYEWAFMPYLWTY